MYANYFRIKPEDFDFSQYQPKKINTTSEIVKYVGKAKKLPNLELIWVYQNSIKNFCEDLKQSDRNSKSTFRGKLYLSFFNKNNSQVVIFDLEIKLLIPAYKISNDQFTRYLKTDEIGKEKIKLRIKKIL